MITYTKYFKYHCKTKQIKHQIQFVNDIIAHKESENKIIFHKEYGHGAIDWALVRGCAYWACKGLKDFVDDN